MSPSEKRVPTPLSANANTYKELGFSCSWIGDFHLKERVRCMWRLIKWIERVQKDPSVVDELFKKK